LGLAGLVALAFWPLKTLTSDDPYITYCYARNLAAGRGFVYNAGEHVLSTTASFYALLLAMGARLGADIPRLSNLLGALGFWGAAMSLFLLARRHGSPWAGVIAAVLCASAPLLWLTLGFEMGLYVALVCWAFWAFDARHVALSAVLLALATMVRNDGVVAFGVVALAWILGWHSLPIGRFIPPLPSRKADPRGDARAGIFPVKAFWRWCFLYVAIVGLWAVWLTVLFGSPIPVTLAAKRIQARFGVSGFYRRTSLLGGLVILWRAWADQAWLHWLSLPLALWGAVVLRRARWAWWVVLWGMSAIVAYALLGVAPYAWYYAPLAPAMALLVGLGVESIGTHMRTWILTPATRIQTRIGKRIGKGAGVVVAVALVLPVLGGQVFSLWRAVLAIEAPVPPPDEYRAKVLPEAKTDIYRRAGEWLARHTPPDAVVGVTEVGIMGYFAQRRMVDFLGLLQPKVARALARGDIRWAIPAYAPDYLALTAINPLYGYPILDDVWFQRAYEPVAYFYDERFWASPVTIYRRTVDAPSLAPHSLGWSVMEGVTLEGWAVDGRQVEARMPLRARLTWRASTPSVLHRARVSVYLLDPSGAPVGQSALRYHTVTWPPNRDVEVYHLSVVADQVPAGRYGLRVRVEDAEGIERFEEEVGWLKSVPAATIPPGAATLDVQAGFAQLAAYTVTPAPVRAGQPMTLTLYWRAQGAADRDWTVFVHLLDGGEHLVAQADGQPFEGRYPTSVWGAGETVPDRHVLSLPDPLPESPCELKVGLYDWRTGERLTLLDGNGHPLPQQEMRLEIP
jgi:hypothetical protein